MSAVITAKDVRDACISPKTQQAYASAIRAMSKWIVDTKGDGSSEYFDANRQINLTVFTPRDFEEFLLEKRKHVTVSTLNGYSSAIKDLHRRNQIPLLAAYEKDFATFFSGLKRMQASKYQKGCPKESAKTRFLTLYIKSCVELPFNVMTADLLIFS
ncbi:hypothetical protein LEN26_012427 [Aphanomyces euteiches]|nr:hypothetical protein AeMF1_016410 [Aphanomyces euteiches]KAH9117813.1 hypothetical protein LEN26_012427 [Aphanomyces euteiches]KAH9182491.1 hypothetical protein AeNC1_015532 [Aphanomyces euteiches]